MPIVPLGLAGLAGMAAASQSECHVTPSILRYEDDIVCLQDRAGRDDDFESLRYFALDDDGAYVLVVGGELRQRYEYTRNPLFGADPQDGAGVWLQRVALHGDLRLGPHVRVFAQLASAVEEGRAGGPSPVDENALALQNGFVDIGFGASGWDRLTLRAGRQEMRFGSGRLVDMREGPNVRRTFDAVRAIHASPDWRVDVFAAWPRDPRPGVFDDRRDRQRSLWGVYATRSDVIVPGVDLDIYLLGFRDHAGTFAQGTRRERRYSLGARFAGAADGWDWNWEAVYQFGDFGAADISAWTLATETGFTFRDAGWRPRLAFRANIASGDDDPDDEHLGTFNPLFPRGNYFSQAAILGPRNFFNLHGFATINPIDRLALAADFNAYWRLELGDGVYAPSGQLIRAPGGSDARLVGTALSLSAEYAVRDGLALAAILARFDGGTFIEATGPSATVEFLELTLQWRF